MFDLTNKRKIILPEEELPVGHLGRFIDRMEAAFPKKQKLIKFQWLMIASSIAAMIAGIFLYLAFYNRFMYQSPMLSQSPTEFYESELYMKSEIEKKITELDKSTNNKEFVKDITKKDKTLEQLRNDLRENPEDMRLVSIVLNVYQSKIDFLDEVLKKNEIY
jgi:hypothetical protein